MEKMSRVERRKLDARNRILKVAEDCFVFEKRYEDITMREIARRSDVSVGALYLHFKTKEDILAHLFVEFDKKYSKIMYETVPATGAGGDRIEGLLTFFDRMCSDPHFILISRIPFYHLKEASTIEDVIREQIVHSMNNFVSFVTEIFEDGKKDGTISVQADSGLAAQVLIDTFISLMLTVALRNSMTCFAELGRKEYDMGSIFSVFKSFLSDGIRISPVRKNDSSDN